MWMICLAALCCAPGERASTLGGRNNEDGAMRPVAIYEANDHVSAVNRCIPLRTGTRATNRPPPGFRTWAESEVCIFLVVEGS